LPITAKLALRQLQRCPLRPEAGKFLDMSGRGNIPLGACAVQVVDEFGDFLVFAFSFLRLAGFVGGVGSASRVDASAQTRGDLPATADPDELAVSLFAALQGGLIMTQAQRNPRLLKIALNHIESLAMRTPELA
jgi:TetR/AcrR family transcriptional repressor of nem operon